MAPAWQPLPPPPGSTPTLVLTNTPTPTPKPPSPTPGGVGLILNNQDICSIKDGLTLPVPVKFYPYSGVFAMDGFADGTLSASAGIQVIATGLNQQSFGVIYFIPESLVTQYSQLNPNTIQSLPAGYFGTDSKSIGPKVFTPANFTFSKPTLFRVWVLGVATSESASISVKITCTVANATLAATTAATFSATMAATSG